MERAVTKEDEELGEFRCESSNMYLSMSSKNSSIPSWYIAMTKDPSTSKYSGSKKCPNVCMFFAKVDNP